MLSCTKRIILIQRYNNYTIIPPSINYQSFKILGDIIEVFFYVFPKI